PAAFDAQRIAKTQSTRAGGQSPNPWDRLWAVGGSRFFPRECSALLLRSNAGQGCHHLSARSSNSPNLSDGRAFAEPETLLERRIDRTLRGRRAGRGYDRNRGQGSGRPVLYAAHGQTSS